MIAGTVWLDDNGNGVREEGEPALGDVAVTLEDESGVVLRSTQSMPSGLYLFMDLFPGTYIVRAANLAGYSSTTPDAVMVTLTPSAIVVLDFGDRPGWRAFLPVQVKTGGAP